MIDKGQRRILEVASDDNVKSALYTLSRSAKTAPGKPGPSRTSFHRPSNGWKNSNARPLAMTRQQPRQNAPAGHGRHSGSSPYGEVDELRRRFRSSVCRPKALIDRTSKIHAIGLASRFFTLRELFFGKIRGGRRRITTIIWSYAERVVRRTRLTVPTLFPSITGVPPIWKPSGSLGGSS